MDQGAAYKNHSPHETSNPRKKDSFIKLIATIFCAAAVLITNIQIDTACTEVIINKDANLLSLETLNAAIIPSKIGTTAPALAARGTKMQVQLKR